MNSDRIQRLFMWLIAIAVVGGTALALKYSRDYRPYVAFSSVSPGDMPANVALRFQDVRVAGRQNNRVAWTMKAGLVQTDQQRSRLDFSREVAAVLMDNGKPRAKVTGPQAVYDTLAKQLVAAGNIQMNIFAQSSNKAGAADIRISAGTVIWSVGSQLVTCPGPVRASFPRGTIEGTDLSVDLRTRAHSLHNIKASVTLDDSAANGDLPGGFGGLVP